MNGTGFPVNGTKGELRNITEECHSGHEKEIEFVTVSQNSSDSRKRPHVAASSSKTIPVTESHLRRLAADW